MYCIIDIIVKRNSRDLDHVFLHNLEKGVVFSFLIASVAPRVSSVELSVVFSVEKMSVEKNMTLNSTINNTKFF